MSEPPPEVSQQSSERVNTHTSPEAHLFPPSTREQDERAATDLAAKSDHISITTSTEPRLLHSGMRAETERQIEGLKTRKLSNTRHVAPLSRGVIPDHFQMHHSH